MQTLLQAGTAVLIDKMSFLIVIGKHATYFAVTEILVYLTMCTQFHLSLLVSTFAFLCEQLESGESNLEPQ